MNENQQAAFIMSQVTCALVNALGMYSDNMQRAVQGDSMAYDSVAFLKLIDEYRIGYNDVLGFFRQQ